MHLIVNKILLINKHITSKEQNRKKLRRNRSVVGTNNNNNNANNTKNQKFNFRTSHKEVRKYLRILRLELVAEAKNQMNPKFSENFLSNINGQNDKKFFLETDEVMFLNGVCQVKEEEENEDDEEEDENYK